MTTGGEKDPGHSRLRADLIGLLADRVIDKLTGRPPRETAARAQELIVRTLEETIFRPVAQHRAANPDEDPTGPRLPKDVIASLAAMVQRGPRTVLGGLSTLIEYGLHQRALAEARLTEIGRLDGELATEAADNEKLGVALAEANRGMAKAMAEVQRLEDALTQAHGTLFDLGPDPIGEEAAIDAATELHRWRKELEEL